MKIDNSNKRYQLIIAGILIIIVAAIFLAFAMGIAGNKNISNDLRNPQTVNQGFVDANNSENVFILEAGHDDVLIDQTVYDEEHHYVQPGVIKLHEDSFDEDFPVCVTPEWGDKQWVVLAVKGGYQPALKNYPGYGDYYGMLKITDKDGNIIMNPCQGMYVGWFLEDYEPVDYGYSGMCECCWVYYNFTLDPHACENWICLNSSYDPDGGNFQDHKYVLVEYDTHWLGCKFDYILAHENHVLRILNSRINKIIISPVECNIL